MFFLNLAVCIPAFCPNEITDAVETYGIFHWPKTLVGETSLFPCPYNNQSFATRECQPAGPKKSEGIWGPILLEQCRDGEGRYGGLFHLAKVNTPCNAASSLLCSEAQNRIGYSVAGKTQLLLCYNI